MTYKVIGWVTDHSGDCVGPLLTVIISQFSQVQPGGVSTIDNGIFVLSLLLRSNHLCSCNISVIYTIYL